MKCPNCKRYYKIYKHDLICPKNNCDTILCCNCMNEFHIVDKKRTICGHKPTCSQNKVPFDDRKVTFRCDK